MKNTLLVIYVVFLSSTIIRAQNIEYTKNIIQELCSEKFAGRGYVNKGDQKAACYIKKLLKENGGISLGKSYFQEVIFPINTFPGKMNVVIGGNKLQAVNEFVVAPNCPSVSGEFPIIYLPEAADTVDALFDSIAKIDYAGKFIVAPFSKRSLSRDNPIKAAGVIIPKESLIWWAANAFNVAKTPLLYVKDSIMLDAPKTISINIQNKFYPRYKSQNVAAYVPGKEKADSFIVFTAHYDHLGLMGKGNMFAGANDNASGTALLLTLAEYYSKPENKPKYTTVFLFFTGEEAGLLGSKYFAEHPLFDLKKVKALINLDMVGSGSEGFAIVNGTENKWISNRLKSINAEKNYFTDILIRGESCNSDHCFFHKKGVPAVFIYTKGKECKEYHNLKDTPDRLPLTKFSELFRLLVEYGK